MKYPAGLVIGLGVLLMLVVKKNMVVVMVATVSLLAFMELGPLGLVMLWPSLLAVMMSRRNSSTSRVTVR